MSETPVNHTDVGVSRVATQYQKSQKFIAYVRALLAVLDEIETLFLLIALQSDIDVAAGTQLDVIGDIVGVSRTIPASVPLTFFGFEDSVPDAAPFGELSDISIGARFRNLLESATASTVVGDPEFRLLIRAKIVKNHSHSLGEEIIDGLAYIFGAEDIIIDEGDMTMQIAIGRTLDILPRGMGVKITQVIGFTGVFPGFS
jgi:hypothetical protein